MSDVVPHMRVIDRRCAFAFHASWRTDNRERYRDINVVTLLVGSISSPQTRNANVGSLSGHLQSPLRVANLRTRAAGQADGRRAPATSPPTINPLNTAAGAANNPGSCVVR